MRPTELQYQQALTLMNLTRQALTGRMTRDEVNELHRRLDAQLKGHVSYDNPALRFDSPANVERRAAADPVYTVVTAGEKAAPRKTLTLPVREK
jgi:hypothetical protein